VIVLFYLISFYALREFISLAYTRRGDHGAIALAFFVALPGSTS
jgi:phosphatidate cytidylyltransferase